MKHLAVALSLIATLAGCPVFAAEPSGVAPGDTLLTLTADGKSTRTPDIASFSAGITTVGKTASAAMAANAEAMTRVIAALKSAGIADRDVQTSNLSLSPVFDNGQQNGDRSRITGYQAGNTVSVRARDVGATGRVIDTLVGAGANEVSGPDFELDHPDAALDEARTAAVTAARSRADLYARAAGLKVLRIVTINESGGVAPPQPMAMMMARKAIGVSTPVAAGEVALNVGVTMQFELAPQ